MIFSNALVIAVLTGDSLATMFMMKLRLIKFYYASKDHIMSCSRQCSEEKGRLEKEYSFFKVYCFHSKKV
jgi:hypothetical protein